MNTQIKNSEKCRSFRFKSVLMTVIAFLLAMNVQAQQVYYVNGSGGSDANDGKSWTNAFETLQAALDKVQPFDEIRVAEGTYYPTKKITADDYDTKLPVVPTDRDMTFVLAKDVRIAGGYNAADGTRDVKLYPTILSGDIGVKGDKTDNCYHVVLGLGELGSAELEVLP